VNKKKVVEAARLLEDLARALSACGEAGMCVKLKHGAVYTKFGYVLPLDSGKWTARSLTWDPLSPPDDDPEDE
jgi:hypothetical protein